MKEAFHIAYNLREVGYVTEFDLNGQEAADLRWIIDVQSRAPQFNLVDRIASRRFEVVTTNEVLKLMEGKGGDKDSPT